MVSAFLWGGLAASSLLIGFALAGRGLSNRTIGVIMGFGAGALVSAIAYELVPESMLGHSGMALGFALGALAFFAGDCFRGRYGVEAQWRAGVFERPWNPPASPCSCGHLDCLSCSKDALLLFLATCCPQLKTLSFAVLDRFSQPSGEHVCIGH